MKRTLIISLLLIALSNTDAHKKTVYLITHFTPAELNGALFNTDYFFSYFSRLKSALAEKKIDLKTPKSYSEELFDAHRILLFNSHWHPQRLKKYKKEQLILVSVEPPCIQPKIHNHEYYKHYGKVLSFRDDHVDNKKCFKLQMPHARCNIINNIPPFNQKKLCTMVSAYNIHKLDKNELSTERIKAVNFFEKVKSNEFDLYGLRWDKKKYKNYKGYVQDKIQCIKNYKFYLCYENCYVPGYISEKIFDCFFAGCVPIYLGASNIKDFIPSKCYIDRRDFPNMQSLYTFIKNMNESTYNEYLLNAKAFLESPLVDLFTEKQFVETIITALE